MTLIGVINAANGTIINLESISRPWDDSLGYYIDDYTFGTVNVDMTTLVSKISVNASHSSMWNTSVTLLANYGYTAKLLEYANNRTAEGDYLEALTAYNIVLTHGIVHDDFKNATSDIMRSSGRALLYQGVTSSMLGNYTVVNEYQQALVDAIAQQSPVGYGPSTEAQNIEKRASWHCDGSDSHVSKYGACSTLALAVQNSLATSWATQDRNIGFSGCYNSWSQPVNFPEGDLYSAASWSNSQCVYWGQSAWCGNVHLASTTSAQCLSDGPSGCEGQY